MIRNIYILRLHFSISQSTGKKIVLNYANFQLHNIPRNELVFSISLSLCLPWVDLPVINTPIILHSPFGQAVFSLHTYIFFLFLEMWLLLVFSARESLSLGQRGGEKRVIVMWSFHWWITPLIRALLAFKCGYSSLHETCQTLSESLVFLPTTAPPPLPR